MTPTRKQMELAARAAGIEGVWCIDSINPEGCFVAKGSVRAFNPLSNGKDSQRLQVKLGMTASVGATTVDACCWTDREELTRTINKALLFDPAIPDDDLRAMREAIFLVAVEIGRAMK